MPSRGTAFTGNTAEEYAQHIGKPVVLATANASEATSYVGYLVAHWDTRQRLCARTQTIARPSKWERRLDQLLARIEMLATNRRAEPSSASQSVAASIIW